MTANVIDQMETGFLLENICGNTFEHGHLDRYRELIEWCEDYLPEGSWQIRQGCWQRKDPVFDVLMKTEIIAIWFSQPAAGAMFKMVWERAETANGLSEHIINLWLPYNKEIVP